MRVIAGKAKHLLLKSVPGLETRPTTDRIKETLFNILQNQIYGCRFLDLFSGSGGMGIEALSRGASYALFVENNRGSVECIRENLKFTKLNDQAEIMSSDVNSALFRINSKEPFHIVFMDPPYQKDLEKQVLEHLRQVSFITEDTLIIVEASKETSFDYLEEFGYKMIRRKEYKTNAHIFIKRAEGADK